MRNMIGALLFIFICVACGKFIIPFVFASALLVHEIGHLLAAKAVGAKILSVKPSFLGLIIKYDLLSVSPIRESIVCISGSVLGIMSAIAVILSDLAKYEFGIDYILISSTLSFMNLLPIIGLDGGEILLCILESFTLPDMAYKISKSISGSITIVFWAITIRIQMRHGINLSMLLVSVYLLYRSLFQ